MLLKDIYSYLASIQFDYTLPNGQDKIERFTIANPEVKIGREFGGPAQISVHGYMVEPYQVPMFLKKRLEQNKSVIKKVVFNDPVTVVIWIDGSKTIVRCQDDEPYDPEKGLAMCIAKKMLGNNGNYYDIFHKYLDEYKEDEAMKKKLAKAVKKKDKKGKKK